VETFKGGTESLAFLVVDEELFVVLDVAFVVLVEFSLGATIRSFEDRFILVLELEVPNTFDLTLFMVSKSHSDIELASLTESDLKIKPTKH